ncbi:TetR family transcriptional regulator C-terminal domain-containing protein [Loigolactobacillus coryniformis]|uniref:TetR-like C-terminal domain-containing protein n=1 Tax=Loigolactobacillus coryniformis TaxID=1610 RepID=UPI0023403E34|nr:TetR-like C-terminal domain-containing protein [Loigolactobacillus coryniformis]MDC4186849.1 TetR family transcriptional regulator C-terminal domain-containing protein [Loigolactobacillus coryniformis]
MITAGKENALIKAFTTAYLYLLKNKIVAPNKRVSQKYWAEFIADAVINMSVRWLQEGQPESPTYMGKLVAKFLHASK